MTSLKQQTLMVLLGSALLTLIFGGLLSLAVNLSLEQLQEQPDLILPSAEAERDKLVSP
jgi:hypothetical protein